MGGRESMHDYGGKQIPGDFRDESVTGGIKQKQY